MRDEHSPLHVAHRASRAFAWSVGNTVVARFGTLAIGIALARVLGPHEFGVFGIALVVQAAILSFNELGVSLAIIRWRENPASFAPTVNTVSAASSAVLTGLVIVAAPQISTLLGDVRATPVVRVLAISILVDGLVTTSAALLQREFMQKERTIADQVNTWFGASLSLGLALFGWGAMSLAVGRLAASLVFAAMLIRWAPLPYRFGWDSAVARRLLRFGLPLAASSIIVFAAGSADQMIVGSHLGAKALGFYLLAFNLASWPVTIFSQPLRAVAPAAFSAIKHDPARLTSTFARVLTILSCVALPACLAISGAADPVVSFVYGSAWAQAADILMWLAAAAGLRILFELAYDFLVVAGRTSVVLLIQACSFCVAVPLMLLAVGPFGKEGVAAVQFVVALAVAAPLYLVVLHRIGVRASRLLTAVLIPSIAAVGTWAVGRGISSAVDTSFAAAAAAGLVAVGVIGGLAFRQREELALLRSAVQRQRVA